jgi:methylmalonyl-CoA mutase cobalamin-binding domain/chain
VAEEIALSNRVRVVTAAALLDGHDAAINIMRRLMQRLGAEVIHLGHNRGAAEIVDAAVMEDAQAIAITSYQGGHVEFFKYVVDLLQERGASHVKVFGGGGGVIVPSEIEELEGYGVAKIYSPEDGRRMGLKGMIEHLLRASDFETPKLNGAISAANARRLASALTQAELGRTNGLPKASRKVPVIGVTGPGGAGKSVLTDELLRRFLMEFPAKRLAVLSVDPSRRKGGGALLARLHAQLRDPRERERARRRDGFGARHLSCRGVRRDLRRELRDRPGRLGNRRGRRCLDLRHDARLRRPVAAREDRHARLRGPRGGQQVGPAGRRRRAARREEAVPPQPRSPSVRAGRRSAPLRDDREPVQ